jgi:hypothetical protein
MVRVTVQCPSTDNKGLFKNNKAVRPLLDSRQVIDGLALVSQVNDHVIGKIQWAMGAAAFSRWGGEVDDGASVVASLQLSMVTMGMMRRRGGSEVNMDTKTLWGTIRKTRVQRHERVSFRHHLCWHLKAPRSAQVIRKSIMTSGDILPSGWQDVRHLPSTIRLTSPP